MVQYTITTERTFDELNRVETKKETTVEDGITTVVGPVVYNYDITTGVGEIKEESEYPGNRTVEKVYDTVGRLKTVTADGETTEYEYYDDGRRESVTYNGDFQQYYTYNDKGLLETLTNKVKNGNGVFEEKEFYRYLYDAAGNMRYKQERIGGITNTTTYNYDKMNRLIRVFEPQRTIVYTYDSRGNRETETVITNSDRIYTEYEYTVEQHFNIVLNSKLKYQQNE